MSEIVIFFLFSQQSKVSFPNTIKITLETISMWFHFGHVYANRFLMSQTDHQEGKINDARTLFPWNTQTDKLFDDRPEILKPFLF